MKYIKIFEDMKKMHTKDLINWKLVSFLNNKTLDAQDQGYDVMLDIIDNDSRYVYTNNFTKNAGRHLFTEIDYDAYLIYVLTISKKQTLNSEQENLIIVKYLDELIDTIIYVMKNKFNATIQFRANANMTISNNIKTRINIAMK